MKTLLEVKGRQAELLTKMKGALSAADEEQRNFSAEEETEYGTWKSEWEQLQRWHDLPADPPVEEPEEVVPLEGDAGKVRSALWDFVHGEGDYPYYRGDLALEIPGTALMGSHSADTIHNLLSTRDAEIAKEAWEHRAEEWALSTAAGPGGNLFDDVLAPSLIQRRIEYNSMERVNSRAVSTPDTRQWEYIISDDTSQEAVRVDELADPTTPTDPLFNRLSIDAYGYTTGTIVISEQLMASSEIGIATVVGGLLGERMGRKLARDFTTGDGSSNPTGIKQHFSDNANLRVDMTAAAQTTTDYNTLLGLVRMEKYVGEAFHPRSVYMMHPDLWYALAELADTGSGATNRRFLQTDYANGVPRRLNGYPVVLNRFLDNGWTTAAADGSLVGCFGSFEFFIRRYVRGAAMVLRRITQDATYIERRQIGLIGFQDVGSGYAYPDISGTPSPSNPSPLVGIGANTA